VSQIVKGKILNPCRLTSVMNDQDPALILTTLFFATNPSRV
jgi:hypothetical protein